MNRANDRMMDVARHLVARETAEAVENGHAGLPVAARVSEKLRRPVSMLAGDMGYQSLLCRALNLSRELDPRLAAAEIKPDGTLAGLGSTLNGFSDEAEAVLVGQLLGLLANFIGEPLTLRMLHDGWPGYIGTDGSSTGTQNEPRQ